MPTKLHLHSTPHKNRRFSPSHSVLSKAESFNWATCMAFYNVTKHIDECGGKKAADSPRQQECTVYLDIGMESVAVNRSMLCHANAFCTRTHDEAIHTKRSKFRLLKRRIGALRQNSPLLSPTHTRTQSLAGWHGSRASASARTHERARARGPFPYNKISFSNGTR